MKHVMIWLIRQYQKFISPLKPPTCRFTPTCSAYAIEAFTKRGFFAGLILTVGRILRCNPFCKGGYDPVPDKGFKRVMIKSGDKQETDTGIAENAQISNDAENTEIPCNAENAENTEKDFSNDED